jgi:predicted alpha/beta-hydrolase family hydrolase
VAERGSRAEVLLGHGASGNAASMRPYVEGLEGRGVKAGTVPATGKLPMRAERAMEVFLDAMAGRDDVVLGGQSYGGRVASMVAAEREVRGLLLFSYPLHRPGHPEELRTDHWARITCPALFLSGEADGFARIDLLRQSVAAHPNFELATYPGVGHGVHRNAAAFADALDRAAGFVTSLG